MPTSFLSELGKIRLLFLLRRQLALSWVPWRGRTFFSSAVVLLSLMFTECCFTSELSRSISMKLAQNQRLGALLLSSFQVRFPGNRCVFVCVLYDCHNFRETSVSAMNPGKDALPCCDGFKSQLTPGQLTGLCTEPYCGSGSG